MKCTIISSCCSILVRDLSYGSEEIFLIDKIEKENNVSATRVQQFCVCLGFCCRLTSSGIERAVKRD